MRLTRLSVFEQITAMISAGQLMRLALYMTGLLGNRVGAPVYFLCDVECPTPTPLPSLLTLERALFAAVQS